jgi:formylglycine-generating enzyme required for sulfatase activity
MEMVTVGDPGNVGELSGRADLGTERLCGAVPYVYQIGKYEVTNAQYRQFLNSVARYGDPYKLHPTAGAYPYRGITRTGSGTGVDPYVYLPTGNDPNWDTKPVNYVSWYSSLRFINWVQNAQPVTEAGPGVTETGTYAFSDPSTVSIPDHSTLTTPHYALPTEDEWYKAAYYKGGGTAAGYWDYATQSDTLPNNNPPDLDTGNSANYSFIDGDPNTDQYAVGEPYWMTDLGAYGLSESAYGTYDQNGNVREGLESLSPYGGNERVDWGGSWAYSQDGLPAFNRSGGFDPQNAVDDRGFRVGLVPEPCTCLLLGAGGVVWVVRTRRR